MAMELPEYIYTSPVFYRFYTQGTAQMKCTVFRSSLKEFTYIYLAEGSKINDLPRSLTTAFGEPVFVMNLELTPERTLAYEDIGQVMKNLAEQGYHLQMPPQDDPTGLLELPEKEETLI